MEKQRFFESLNHHRSYINGQLSIIMLNNENGEIYGEGEQNGDMRNILDENREIW